MPHRVRDTAAGIRGFCFENRTLGPAILPRAGVLTFSPVCGLTAARLRPKSAIIAVRSLHLLTRAHAEPAKTFLAHLYRTRPAAGADGRGGAFGRHCRAGVGAVLQFWRIRRAATTAPGRTATARRW